MKTNYDLVDEMMKIVSDTMEWLGKVPKHSSSALTKLTSRVVGCDYLANVEITSPAFENGGFIPKSFSNEGMNKSPALQWTTAPLGTKQWLLVCEDPDAPRLEPFVHWILSGLPSEILALPEKVAQVHKPNLPFASTQSCNGKDTLGYTGPMPPVGHGIHRYYFQLFALDTMLNLPQKVSRAEIAHAIKNHVVGFGELVGQYERT